MWYDLYVNEVLRLGGYMKLKDPCKKCIVRSCCKEMCDKKREYWDTRDRIITYAFKILVILAFVNALYHALI